MRYQLRPVGRICDNRRNSPPDFHPPFILDIDSPDVTADILKGMPAANAAAMIDRMETGEEVSLSSSNTRATKWADSCRRRPSLDLLQTRHAEQ